MPNRVLKDSITCSKQIDSLTWFQEVMFYRLIVKADDFGRYYADPQIVKSELFPRKEDLTKKAVIEALDALEIVGLINRYQWDEVDYLQITKWEDHQQRRATKSKFPDINGSYTISDGSKRKKLISNDIKRNQVISSYNNGNQMSPNTKSNTKSKPNPNPIKDTPFADEEELISIQQEHNELFEAAKDVGLPLSNQNMKELIDMYKEFGFDAVKHGIHEAGKYNKISIAYILGAAKNYGKEKPKDEDEELPDISKFW